MLKYISKRFIYGFVIVWGVLSLTFLVVHLAPGDPASLYLRPDIDARTVANLRSQMGLDLPLWKQYFKWTSGVIRGNFGVSFIHQRPVREILLEAVLNTLQLTVVVFVLQLLLGIALGVFMAIKENTKLDLGLGAVLLFFYSMPGFWLALMGILVFSYQLNWLPASQMQSFDVAGGFTAVFVDRIRHILLPASVLTLPLAASTAKYVRNSFIEILRTPYMRTAKAYGLKPGTILLRYAMKNALLPVVTLFGLNLPFLIGGAVVTEYIFSWPGMGRVTVNAIFAHDFPVVLASTFLAAVAVVIGNQISDILYAFADPRIRVAPD